MHPKPPSFTIQENGAWNSDSLKGHCFDPSLSRAIGQYCLGRNWRTVADMGCGAGWYVRELRAAGISAEGYDGNPHTEALSRDLLGDGTACRYADLSKPFILPQPVDCVLSLEVGEHIPERYEPVFIRNLTRNAGQGVILSWAVPGQAGDGHVNCRSNGYLMEKMVQEGFAPDPGAMHLLRLQAVLPWFFNTVMVFNRM